MSMVLFACTIAFACVDEPTAAGGSATTPCVPLADRAVIVSHEGITTDGHYVVVLGDGSTARVFYGAASHLVEGVIAKRQGGCAFEIDFEVEGRAYAATFSPGPPTCMVASTLVSGNPDESSVTVALTVLTATGAPTDAGTDGGAAPLPLGSLSFYCL